MVLSYYLWKIPYSIIWEAKNLFGKNEEIIFYCADELDWIIFRNVHKHLKNIKIVSKNKKVQSDLKKLGIKSSTLPSFPKTVIMTRHALHKFPYNKVRKIGMRHGPYHFKQMIDKKKYNAFDLFFMTSQKEVRQAKKVGITSAVSGGFPKLDDMIFLNDTYKMEFKEKLKITNSKPIILFTATWNKSGMSAIKKWYDKLDLFTQQYNVFVTTHPFMETVFIDKIKEQNAYFIEDKNILPYISIADVVVGDTSSILAECCALDKPIITFKILSAKRLTSEILTLLEDISYRIDSIDELDKKINVALLNPDFFKENRKKWNKIMFDKLDGKSGERMAKAILGFINKTD